MTDHEINVTCSRCGAPMAVRNTLFSDRAFLGCSAFPRCRYTEPMPASTSAEVERAGGQPLPGMDL